MQIIIPMSGIGKRFIDAGYIDPKPLIMIEGKPIIEHIINLFENSDTNDYIFICNDKHLRETNMREILMRITNNKCKIFEVSVNDRKGPVDAVLQAFRQDGLIDMNKKTIVSYCDYGTVWHYNNFLNMIDITDCDGSIACYTGFHPHMLGTDNYAFVREDTNTPLKALEIREKKPFTNNKMNEWASNGTYYFKNARIVEKYFKKTVELNMHVNNEYYVSVVYNLLINDGLYVNIFETQKMLQWGTPKDLEEYLVWSNYFLNRTDNFNYSNKTCDNLTLILPMAGAGSRFFNDGYKIPKPLLEVENLPMIIKAVNDLPKTVNKIFICQNEHLKNYDIEKTLHKHYDNVNVVGIDHVTDGQACTCEIAINKFNIDDDIPILISACDNGIYYDIDKFNHLMNDTNIDVIIFTFSNNPTSKLYPHMYAWIDVDENDNIKRVSVKKPFNDVENKYAIIGTMLFKKCKYFKDGLKIIYDKNIRTNNEYYVDNMIQPLVEKGLKCKIFDVDYYLCWGTPNDYKTYNYWHEYFVN